MTTREEFGLYSLNIGDKVQIMTNPFNGDKIKVPIDEGFSRDEQDSLKNLLEQKNWINVDEDGYRECTLESGNHVWVRDYDFPMVPRLSSIAIEIDIEDIYVADLLFKIMEESNAILGQGIDSFISTTLEMSQRASERWKSIVFVDSPDRLLNWLEFGK